MSLLNQLITITDRKKKRLGRGYGSGKGGHTTNRGQKGQKTRSNNNVHVWFEGGGLPLTKRLPMLRGKGKFKQMSNVAQITFDEINRFDFDVISLKTLKANRIIEGSFQQAKVIKRGQLKKKITVKGLQVSAGAAQEIKTKGGSIEE